jgi:hypothetical protein
LLLVGALVLFVLFMLGVVVGPAKVIAPQPEAPKPTKVKPHRKTDDAVKIAQPAAAPVDELPGDGKGGTPTALYVIGGLLVLAGASALSYRAGRRASDQNGTAATPG